MKGFLLALLILGISYKYFDKVKYIQIEEEDDSIVKVYKIEQ